MQNGKEKKPKEPKPRYRLVLLQNGEPLPEEAAKAFYRKVKERHAHKLGQDKEARLLFQGHCPKMDNGYYACPGVCIKQKFVTRINGCASCAEEEMVKQVNYVFSKLPDRFPGLELTRVPIKVGKRRPRKPPAAEQES